MKIADKIVVVTGGAGGIGAAMARRFADEGAAAVVVVDRDGAAATVVADSFGGLARRCDVTDPAAVEALVSETVERFGRIDLFCSNAGIATDAGLDAPLAVWQAAFEVNVLAHVHAARAVVPHMLRAGSGWLLNTASAAGLLTTPGDAPYSVTKHGAVALAEWLAVTYGDQGIGVSVVCPLGVATQLLTDLLDVDSIAGRVVAASGEILTPEAVADAIVAGLAAETFLILPHPEVANFWSQKAADPDRWLRGMRRLVSKG